MQQHIVVHSTDLSKNTLLFLSTFFCQMSLDLQVWVLLILWNCFSQESSNCVQQWVWTIAHIEFHFCFHTAVVDFQDHMLSPSMDQLTSFLNIHYCKENGDRKWVLKVPGKRHRNKHVKRKASLWRFVICCFEMLPKMVNKEEMLLSKWLWECPERLGKCM